MNTQITKPHGPLGTGARESVADMAWLVDCRCGHIAKDWTAEAARRKLREHAQKMNRRAR